MNRIVRKVLTFSLTDTLALTEVSEMQTHTVHTESEQSAEPSMPVVPFSMSVEKKAEQQAKSSVQLPFTDAQRGQGPQFGQHKVRVGGQVLYTPDEADDLDDSDPDDDLHI